MSPCLRVRACPATSVSSAGRRAECGRVTARHEATCSCPSLQTLCGSQRVCWSLWRLQAQALSISRARRSVVDAFSTTCDSLATLTLANGRITSASLVSPGSFTPPGAAGRAGASSPYGALPFVLPRRGNADADGRLRYQDRSLASRIGLEREVAGGWKRRLGRHDFVRRARVRARARLRDGQHGHGALHSRRRVCDESPREDGGLRAPCRARDDRAGEGARRRHSTEARRSSRCGMDARPAAVRA